MMRSLCRALLGLVLVVPFGSFAQLVGPEFRVNTYTSNLQRAAAVAVDGSGSFVVLWSSQNQESAASGLGIFGQRHASPRAPRGGAVPGDAPATHSPHPPAGAAHSAGGNAL